MKKSESEPKKLFPVAKITSARGSSGVVNLIATLDDPENLLFYKEVFWEDGTRVNWNLKKSGKNFTALIEEFTSPEASWSLKNKCVYVYKSALEENLAEDEFLISDLVGLKVLDNEHNILGKVIDVLNVKGSSIIEIEYTQGEIKLAVFNKETFPEVNLGLGHIVFLPPLEI